MKRLKLVKYKKKGVRRGSGRGRKKYDKTVFLKCKECGKYFEIPDYNKTVRKFCSRTCGSRYNSFRRRTHTVKNANCLLCGEEFTYKSFPYKKQQRFCSTDCCNRFHRVKACEENRRKLYEQVERDYNELMRYV